MTTTKNRPATQADVEEARRRVERANAAAELDITQLRLTVQLRLESRGLFRMLEKSNLMSVQELRKTLAILDAMEVPNV